MTRIDFYLQQAKAAASLDNLVCRLVDKAFRQGHRTYVLTTDVESAMRQIAGTARSMGIDVEW